MRKEEPKTLTSERARVLGKLGAHVAHSRHSGEEMTTPARRAFMARFEAEVDPEGLLEPLERARRAEHAKRAYFSRLALLRHRVETT